MLLTLTSPEFSPAATPAPSFSPQGGKILEELHYRVNVWIWRDALKTKVMFQEVGAGRYRADLTGRSQGLLSLVSGDWQGGLSTEMEYSQGKLRPLVYREVSNKRGQQRMMEYRFDYNRNIVELWKSGKDNVLTKHWETTFTGPMYDPLSFFYNRRLTGPTLGAKGGENIKIQGIPYPKPEEILLRVGDNTPEGLKIMLELGNIVFKGERNQVYAYLDADGIPTKIWTKVMKFGNVDIELLPGGKRLNKKEVTGTQNEASAVRNFPFCSNVTA